MHFLKRCSFFAVNIGFGTHPNIHSLGSLEQLLESRLLKING